MLLFLRANSPPQKRLIFLGCKEPYSQDWASSHPEASWCPRPSSYRTCGCFRPSWHRGGLLSTCAFPGHRSSLSSGAVASSLPLTAMPADLTVCCQRRPLLPEPHSCHSLGGTGVNFSLFLSVVRLERSHSSGPDVLGFMELGVKQLLVPCAPQEQTCP